LTTPQSNESERELIRRAKEGDADAISGLLQQWQPALEGIARSLHRRYGRLGFDTHDLVATSIRRLLRNRAGVPADERDLAFLQHILRDAYSEKARMELRRRRHETAAHREHSHAEPAPEPITTAPAEQSLPADWSPRATPEEWELVLLWKQGLSWEQIGAHLEVPAETARKRWHRLIRQIREREGSKLARAGEASPGASPAPPSADPPSDRAADRDRRSDPSA